MGTRKMNGRCLLRDYDPPKEEDAFSRQIDADWLKSGYIISIHGYY